MATNLLAQLRKDNPRYAHYDDDQFIDLISSQAGIPRSQLMQRIGGEEQSNTPPTSLPTSSPTSVIDKLRADNPRYRHYSDEQWVSLIAENTNSTFEDAASMLGYQPPEPEPISETQEERPSGFTGLLGNVVRGAKQAGRSIGAMGNTITGDLATVEDYARRSQESAEKEMPEEQRQLHSELQAIDREQGAMGQIGDTLGAAARNPMGTAQLITEQIPNSAVSLGSGWAGFKTGAALGAAAGPVGAGIGGTLGFLGGMFLGNYMLEGGSKAIEKAEGGFTEDERRETLTEGAKKAGVITAVDAATFKAGSMIANRLGGAAAVKNGAKAEAEVLMKAGVDMSSPATINAALAKSPELMKQAKIAGERAAINTLSRSKKAGIAGTGLSLETVGEGAGEYLGEMAATGEGDVVDATIEALAGFSQSAVQTAYNYNRLGNKLNPENIRKQAEEINQARTQEGINNIANAETVDDAIQAAADTAAQKPVTPGDVMDDIAYREELLKRTEAFTQGGANEETQQEASTQPVQAAEVLGAQPKTARDTEIVLPDNTNLPAQWDVIDASQVQATMKEGENQPRDRTRTASESQIAGIANNPNYALVSDSPVMDVGAPVLDNNGAIVAGNGRFEGLSRAYQLGTATQYKERLMADAARKGIDPAVIAGMERPILVRRVTQPIDTRKTAIKSNSGLGLQYSALELAKIDAERMKNLSDIEVSDNGDIVLNAQNIQKLRNVLSDYDASELGALVDKDGMLSQEGVRRVKSAILHSAYGDSPTLGRMIESTDNDIRNITGALTKVAGNVAKVRNDIKQGAIPEELDITNDLIEAVEKLAELKARNQPVDNYLAQQGLFGENITPESREFIQFLSNNMRSQKKLTEFINSVYDSIGSIDTSNPDIFGDTPIPSKQDVIQHAKQRKDPGQQDGATDSGTAQQSQTRSENQRDPQERSGQGQKDERLIPVSKRGELSTNDSKEVFSRFAELGSDLNTADQAVIDAEEITGLHLGLTVRKTRLDPGVPARFILSERVIEVSDNWNYERWKGAQFIAEEILHAVDSVGDNKTLSASSVRLNLKNGDIALEAKRIHDSNSIYRKFLDYPLGIDYKDLSDTQKQAELFARLGVLYFGEPEKMRQILPIAYGAFNEIFMVSTHPVTREVHRKIWTTPDRNIEVRTRHGSGRQDDVSDRRVVEGRENSELGRLRESIGAHFEADPRGAKVTFNRSRTDDRLIPLSERNKNDGVNENNVDYNDRQSNSSDKINEGVEGASANQRKSSYNPNNLSLDLGTRNLDLDYGEIEQRPGTTEKQRELGRNAYRELLERAAHRGQGSLLGAAIAKDFKEHSGSTLVGRTVQSPEDLAVLAQVLRDPRFETFRIFFTKGDLIVHHTGVTSRMPASSRVHTQLPGETAKQAQERYVASVKQQMKDSGADGYYLLHNHPTGKAEPSVADIKLTEFLNKSVPGFKNHVIIDHNEYGVISMGDNSTTSISEVVQKELTGGYSNNNPSVPHNALRKNVIGPESLAEIGKMIERKDGYFTLIGLGAQLNVVSIAEFPADILNKPDIYLLGALRRFARHSGADSVAAVADNRDDIGKLHDAVFNRVLIDVIDAKTGKGSKGAGGRKLFDIGNSKNRAIQVKQDNSILRSTPAWHGSPHDHDQFSMDKIGSGEGAQAYGHGLYFAGNREVAEWYKNKLSGDRNLSSLTDKMDRLKVNGQRLLDSYDIESDDLFADQIADGDIGLAVDHAEGRIERWAFLAKDESYPFKDYAKDKELAWRSLVPEIKNGNVTYSGRGKLYQVELAPEQDEYLLWDKPLSEQSEKVKKIINSGLEDKLLPLRGKKNNETVLDYNEGMTGEELYKTLSGRHGGYGSDKKASEYLHSIGIRGIKYLDGSSRSKGDGAYNYVIFDDKDVSIVNKYSKRKRQAKSLSVDEVKQAVNPLRSRLGNGIKINVVQSTSDIPERVHERSVEDSVPIDTDGVYDPAEKTVYLIADNIPSAERALWVALHETVGHAGLRSLGKDVRQTIAYASKNKFVADLGKAIAKDRQQDYDAIHHNEEAIAELSAALLSDNVDAILERYGVAVPKDARRNLDSIIQRVVEAIRRFVSNMMGKVTDQQIRELVMAAKVAVEGGRIESGKAANDYIKESLRLIRGGYKTVGDFIIPETPEYADNFTGDLAHVPDNDSIPVGPLRVEVGKVISEHRGWGISHLADNAIRDSSRMPRKETGDLAEDLMRDAIVTMNGVNAVHNDGNTYIFVNPSSRKSIVTKFSNGYYSVVSVRPYNNDPVRLWGNSEWRGRLTFPRPGDSASPLSAASHQDNDSPSLDRNGLDSTSRDKFTIPESNEKGQDKKQPTVTTKKRRNIEEPKLSSSPSLSKMLEDYKSIYNEMMSDEFINNNDFDKWVELRERADSIRMEISGQLESGRANGIGIDGNSLLSRNTTDPKNPWRITYLTKDGEPNGHSEYKSAKSAVDDFLTLSRTKKEMVLFSRAQTLSNAGVNTTTTQAGKASTTLPEETKFQAFRRKTQDAMLRFKLVQEWLNEQGVNLTEAANVYQRENISKGKTANLIENFRNKELEPLIKDIAEAKFELGDIATYLEARHIPEANARMRQIHNDPNATANGITDQQAQKVLADFQAMPNFKEFEKLAGRVWNIGQETLDMRLNAGLISQEQYDAYKNTYKNWVPLRGNVNPQGFGKGLSTSHKDKRRMGHGFREDEFVLENLVQDRERAIMQVEKNKVSLSVLEFLMQANNPEIGTVGKPQKRATIKDHSYAVEYKGQVVGSFENKGAVDSAVLKILNGSSNLQLPGVASIIPQDLKVVKTYDPRVVMMARSQLEDNEISVMINGSSVRMQLNDPLLARAGTAAGIEQVGGILEAARSFNRFLSKAYTSLSPDFFLTNMFRDAYSGTLVLTGKQGGKFTAKVFKNYASSFRDLWKARKDPAKSQWVTRYRNAGGNIGAAWLSDLDRVGQDAMAALQRFAGARQTYNMVYSEQKANGASDKKARTMAILKAGKAKVSSLPVIGNLFEMVERVNAVIENTLRLATFRTAIESGLSDQQSAMLSKDLLNFNRKGEQTSQLGALYLFFNPAAQSAHITAEALFTSPHKKQVWALLSAMTALSFLLSELGRGDDEDEWDKIPEHIKDRNLVFKYGDMQATIPVSYGWGFAHSFGRLVSDFLHGEDASKVAVKLAASFVDNFSPAGNPIDTGDNDTNISAFQLLPTIPKMIVGPSVNMNSFGNEIYPHKYNESMPDSQLASRGVRGTIYQDLADFLNDTTGGSKYEPGVVSISPNTIKYWVTSLAGGAGRFVSDIFTGAMDAASGVAPELENVPVARRFVRESGVKDSRAAFWKAKKEAQAAAERFNRAVKDGEIYYAQESFDKHGDLIALAKFADANAKMSAYYRDAVLEIQLDKEMSKTEKKSRIKELEMQEKVVYDEFLSVFREVKK